MTAETTPNKSPPAEEKKMTSRYGLISIGCPTMKEKSPQVVIPVGVVTTSSYTNGCGHHK